MAVRTVRLLAKLSAALFTSVVAPILVNVAVRDLNAEGPEAQSAGQASAQPRATSGTPMTSAAATPLPLPAETAQVLARGEGKSQAEALSDALHNALRLALAARVGAVAWERDGQVLSRVILGDGTGLILRWEDRSSTSHWRLGGRVYRREVAATVNCRVLVDRLRTAVLPPQPNRLR
jgi:hypothetical protein